ncbi:arginine ABC transporter permease ArtQ [Orbaceae bacterium ac157xtp]
MNDWIIYYILPLLQATSITLLIALASMVFGLLLALVFTLAESSRFKPTFWLFSNLILVIRGLPEILIVIAIYNGIPLILNILADGFDINLYFIQIPIQIDIEDFNVNPIICGITALSIIYACYASQTLRGAFKAVSVGQKQAAEVLGLSKFRTLTHIIIPQMWRHALPGLGNQWLVLLKDTALVSLISVNDIMMQTRGIISHTRQPFTWYLIAGAIYLIISIISQKILKRLEKRTTYFEQNAETSSVGASNNG